MLIIGNKYILVRLCVISMHDRYVWWLVGMPTVQCSLLMESSDMYLLGKVSWGWKLDVKLVLYEPY